MQELLTPKRLALRVSLAGLVLLAVMVLCVMTGPERISVSRVLAGPARAPGENIDYELVVGIRLPRVLLAAIVGAALACAGLVLQAILRNPLADPYILGISSGAGLGVTIAVLVGAGATVFGVSTTAAFAFVGSVGAVWLVWTIGHFTVKSQVTGLILAGVVVNAFFSAVMMFLISVARSEQFYSTVLWLMGNITEKRWPALAASAGCIVAGVFGLFRISHRLNILSFGDEHARSLGVDPARTKTFALVLAALITAVAVGLSGLIGFVGLIVPHATRLVFGPEHRQLVPLGALVGAAFLVAADTLARTIVAPAQMPVGVITAIAGGPFFLLLLARYTKKSSWLSK
jgi:iron complex transport system permease protein